MKDKDTILLEEAYLKVCESMINRTDYYEDALQNPKDYELNIETLHDEDWDGNIIYRTIAYLYKVGDYKNYDRIDNPDDIDILRDTFEKHNPDGINDQR